MSEPNSFEEYVRRGLHDLVDHERLSPERRLRILRATAAHPRPASVSPLLDMDAGPQSAVPPWRGPSGGRWAARRRLFWGSGALAAAVALMIALVLILRPQSSAPIDQPLPQFTAQHMTTPDLLAQGGHLVSIDPTGHYLLFAPAGPSGVYYTATLGKTQSTLAMNDADVPSWAPDGSGLITTVDLGNHQRLLAVIAPVGSYMRPVGPQAIIATWTQPDRVLYAQQDGQTITLWTINPSDAHSATRLASLTGQAGHLVDLAWSPDGARISLVTQEGSRYHLWTMRGDGTSVQQRWQASGIWQGRMHWSPNSQMIAFATQNAAGATTLQTLAMTTNTEPVTLAGQGTLNGLSWSSDGRYLVYGWNEHLKLTRLSDQRSETLRGSGAQQGQPFWLPNGTILYQATSQTGASLEALAPRS
jgi:Tol biopolymer transport system component